MLTVLMAIFAIPGFVLYIISNPSYDNAVVIYGINRKSFVRTTLGNLGRGGYTCGNGKFSETIYLSCPYGEINNFVSAGYASSSSKCSSEVFTIVLVLE